MEKFNLSYIVKSFEGSFEVKDNELYLIGKAIAISYNINFLEDCIKQIERDKENTEERPGNDLAYYMHKINNRRSELFEAKAELCRVLSCLWEMSIVDDVKSKFISEFDKHLL